MKPTPAEVRPDIDLAMLRSQWDLACGKEARAEKTLAETRLEKGRLLVMARRAFPARGPKAKGWGELLATWKVNEDTALNYMKLAGHVEEISLRLRGTDTAEIPTYAEAGITRSKARPVDVEIEIEDADAPPAVQQQHITEEKRNSAYQREVAAALPKKIEQREREAHAMVEMVADARAKVLLFTERDIHLTDVTTSPDDFMRVKQGLIDIVNRCLDELSRAGVLDGKEQRRQLQLLDGGKR